MLPMVQIEPVPFNSVVHSVDGTDIPSPALPPSLTPALEVEEVDIFFDVDIAVNTYSRIESCDLQLGDTWRGKQDKMSVSALVKKIRKKENKPQSQINKCHNEKRRRELENETINQLEELLGTCLAEVKQPDKNGIVREATRQIQEVLKRRRDCPGECPLRVARCLPPVQAGEVSSTQPQPPPHGLHYSELTTLIEALKHYTSSLGWVLLEINSEGEIECVTENIKEIVQQDRTDLYKKAFLSLLHTNDHSKLKPLLRSVRAFGWGSAEIDKFQAIQARLIKQTNDTEVAGYVECVIHAAPVRGPSPEEPGAVMCVIRRIHDASAALLPGDGGPPATATAPAPTSAPALTHRQPDHIVFRLDCNFIILFCDLSGVENSINSPLSLVGSRYLDLIESGDRLRVAAHLQEAVCHPAPPAVSEPFRLRVAVDKPWIRVAARSRLFRAKPTSGESDFIMSTHTLLNDDDVNILEANAAQPPVGGPLMTSVANGESSGCDTRYRSSMSPAEPAFSMSDFDLEPWASTFQLTEMSNEDTKDRKDLPEGPPTPRTPATPGEVPPVSVPGEEPNRLRILLSKKPSPVAESNTNSSNRILKDLLKQEDEDATGSETSAPHTPHTPLTPHTPHTPSSALSPLHTAQSHSRPAPLTPHPTHQPHTPHPPHTTHQSPNPHIMKQSHQNNSDMLLKILNEKSDEDAAEENRRNSMDGSRNVPHHSALLTQLLSCTNGPSSNGRAQDAGDDYFGKLATKRKQEDTKGGSTNPKRATPETQQVSTTALSIASSMPSSTASSLATSATDMSPLCRRNQILVSLLARRQPVPTAPVPLPNARPYSTAGQRPPVTHAPHQSPHPSQHSSHTQHQPQGPPPTRPIHSTLSTILATRASSMNGGSGGGECGPMSAQSHLQIMLQGPGGAGARSGYPPTPPPHSGHGQPQLHYGNTAPHHSYNQPSGSGGRVQSGVGGGGDNEVQDDPELSTLLEVIANMPDTDRSIPDALIDDTQRQLRSDYTGIKEKNAMINAIRQSLMQYETVAKNPVSSPGPPPVYPVQSPGACTLSGGGGGGGTSASFTMSSREGGVENARARVLEERARLLQLQRSQHMLVSPEAAEQPQGSTISALVSATPPNVALTRTDFHLYHPSNQIGSNFANNKITSTQQNPMLSRQLSLQGSGGGGGGSAGGGGGVSYAPGAAALHTPLTPQPSPQPYHRAPRPHLVGSYYEESAGVGAGTGAGGGAAGGAAYCIEFARRAQHAHTSHPSHPTHGPLAPHHEQQLQCGGNSGVGGVGGGSGTSEYVRNELRAVVGARTNRPDQLHPQLQPQDLESLIAFEMPTPEYYGGGLGGGGGR